MEEIVTIYLVQISMAATTAEGTTALIPLKDLVAVIPRGLWSGRQGTVLGETEGATAILSGTARGTYKRAGQMMTPCSTTCE